MSVQRLEPEANALTGVQSKARAFANEAHQIGQPATRTVRCKFCWAPIDRQPRVGRPNELHPECADKIQRDKKIVYKLNQKILYKIREFALRPNSTFERESVDHRKAVVEIDQSYKLRSHPFSPGHGYIVDVNLVNKRVNIKSIRDFLAWLGHPIPEDIVTEPMVGNNGIQNGDLRYVETLYIPRCPRCDVLLETDWFEDRVEIQRLEAYLNRCSKCKWYYPKFKNFAQNTVLDRRNVQTLDQLVGIFRGWEKDKGRPIFKHNSLLGFTPPKEKIVDVLKPENFEPKFQAHGSGSQEQASGVRPDPVTGKFQAAEWGDHSPDLDRGEDVGHSLAGELTWEQVRDRAKAEVLAISPETPRLPCKCGRTAWELDLEGKPPNRYQWMCTVCGETFQRRTFYKVLKPRWKTRIDIHALQRTPKRRKAKKPIKKTKKKRSKKATRRPKKH